MRIKKCPSACQLIMSFPPFKLLWCDFLACISCRNRCNSDIFIEKILCFSAWLRNDDSPVVARLSRLIEAVTNLSMITAEDLQVCGYFDE